MTNCPFCNSEIQEALAYCPECGKKLISGPELPKRELHVSKPARLAVLIISGILFLALLASILFVLIPKKQKTPAELFVDYDLAFSSYYSNSYVDEYALKNPPLANEYEEEDAFVQVSLSLTNLMEKEIMPGSQSEIEKGKEYPVFYFWYPEEGVKDSYLRRYMSWGFYDEAGNWYFSDYDYLEDAYEYAKEEPDDTYYTNNWFVKNGIGLTLKTGESSNIMLSANFERYAELAMEDCYVEAFYNDESYYWDLATLMEAKPELNMPWETQYDLTLSSYFLGSAKESGSDEVFWADEDSLVLHSYGKLSNNSGKPLDLMQEDLFYPVDMRFRCEDIHGDESFNTWSQFLFYNDDGVLYTSDLILKPGESVNVLVYSQLDVEQLPKDALLYYTLSYCDGYDYIPLENPMDAAFELSWQTETAESQVSESK